MLTRETVDAVPDFECFRRVTVLKWRQLLTLNPKYQWNVDLKFRVLSHTYWDLRIKSTINSRNVMSMRWAAIMTRHRNSRQVEKREGRKKFPRKQHNLSSDWDMRSFTTRIPTRRALLKSKLAGNSAQLKYVSDVTLQSIYSGKVPESSLDFDENQFKLIKLLNKISMHLVDQQKRISERIYWSRFFVCSIAADRERHQNVMQLHKSLI